MNEATNLPHLQSTVNEEFDSLASASSSCLSKLEGCAFPISKMKVKACPPGKSDVLDFNEGSPEAKVDE